LYGLETFRIGTDDMHSLNSAVKSTPFEIFRNHSSDIIPSFEFHFNFSDTSDLLTAGKKKVSNEVQCV
jgi:hypothetical protein